MPLDGGLPRRRCEWKSCRRFLGGHKYKKFCNIRHAYNARLGVFKEGSKARYVTIRVDGKKVYLHRWVMEQKLGRPLEYGEIVHHKDKNRLNNDPDNLELCTDQGAHMRHHHWEKTCGHMSEPYKFDDPDIPF
jgi:hypothetical protein